jgi:nucleotide-binding universal stress UspA family protein
VFSEHPRLLFVNLLNHRTLYIFLKHEIMKKILAPTDFSAPAANAVDYAAKFADCLKAELTLLNCCHIPVMATGETTLPVITIDELEKESRRALDAERKRLQGMYPGLKVDTHCCVGFAVEEVASHVKQFGIDLVVMGITGAGKFSELVIGSTATALVQQLDCCPVLIIPEEARFEEPHRIALACDLKEVVHPECFDSLKEVVSHFGADLNVVSVMKPGEEINVEKAANGIKVEHLLEDVNHTLHFTEEKDVVKGIEDFVERHKVNMVSMVARKHNFVDRIFHESNTKKMAFHTHVPLLALHE